MRYLLFLAFGMGTVYAGMQFTTKKNSKDIDGLAAGRRADVAKAQRRWLQDMATDLDEVDHTVARKVAKRLREEAWRS